MSVYSDFVHNKKPKLLALGLLVLFIGGGSIFASLADEVREGDTVSFDTAVLLGINSRSSPLLDTVFSTGTMLGGAVVVAAVSLAMITALALRKSYSRALLATLIIGGTTLANFFLKLVFERSRPELWTRLVEEQSFSFPSGHAMASMALGLTIVLLTWNTRWRAAAVIGAIVYVLFIGFSRLYLGVHYPTDILAGWLVSSLWVFAIAWLFSRRKNRTDHSGNPE